MARITVKVRDLRKGDLLLGSKRRVEAVYAPGLYTPKGKREVLLQGETGYRVWGANTTITIEREG